MEEGQDNVGDPGQVVFGTTTLVLAIARVAHEANREYCKTIGDDSQPHWNEAPAWQKDSAIKGAQFHLDSPESTPEQSHQNWLNQKTEEGWIRGDVKNVDRKEHPCMVPYDQLPADQKIKDYLFRGIVHSFSEGLKVPETAQL